MSVFELHLLVGDPALMFPDLIHGQDIADLCGTDFRCVPAYWLSSKCGRYNHNFLVDDIDDNRIEVFARSLVTDYARVSRPLLVIPALLEDHSALPPPGCKDWGTVLVALSAAIRNLGRECAFDLHLLTLSTGEDAYPQLSKLRIWLESQGLNVRVSEDAVKRPPADAVHVDRLEANYIATQVAMALTERCQKLGMAVSDPDRLSKSAWQCLKRWTRIGLRPNLPLDDAFVKHLSEAVMAEAAGPFMPALAGNQGPA